MESNNMSDNNIQLFEDKPIRTAWDDEKEEWYFCLLYTSPSPRD